MAVLLELNGLELVADETVATIRALAAGEVSEDELTEWVRGHVQPLGEEPSGPTP